MGGSTLSQPQNMSQQKAERIRKITIFPVDAKRKRVPNKSIFGSFPALHKLIFSSKDDLIQSRVYVRLNIAGKPATGANCAEEEKSQNL